MKAASEVGKESRNMSTTFSESEPRISETPANSFEDSGDGSSAANQAVVEMLIHFGKVFLYLFPVYLVGYLGLSISWVLFALMLWMWWKRNRTSKLNRFAAAVGFLDNERHVITEGLKELNMPAWVHFPDVEKADWLNQILDQAWPYFGIFMEKVFRNSIEPAVRASNIHLKTFTFTKIHFGEKPLKIKGVKAYTKGVDKRQVILDLQISYVADCEINVEIKKICKAGVKGMQLHGTLRVILEPLIGQSPLVGGVTFFFIRRPNLKRFMLHTSDMSDGAILDIISSYMVLPNRYCVPLIDQVQLAQMRFPLPSGVVRVHLIEAEDLVPKDTYMMGMVKGKSDPYANLRVGTQSNRSKTIKENLNPKWNEVYEFVVHEAPGQDLELEMFDEDPDKDDFLGSLVIELGEVMNDRVVDERNHFEYSNNEYGMKKNKNPKYLKSKKSNGEPSAHVEFSIDKELQKSKIKDDDKKCVLGVLSLPLKRLLTAAEMTMDQRFQLEHAGPSSMIKMKAMLRVLVVKDPDPDSVYTGLNALKKGPLSLRNKRSSRNESSSPTTHPAYPVLPTPPAHPAHPAHPANRLNSALSEDNLERESSSHYNLRPSSNGESKPMAPATPSERTSSVSRPRTRFDTQSIDMSICSSRFDLTEDQIPFPKICQELFTLKSKFSG
ncbi:Extended synaptotagmin-3 [Acipenser ruthenus]|uniref:Extended synaptotagmin-3 n=1 Tax=Acipenser ruthenus TaxID=7906 RepID=A0A444UPV8_ACIRT|nr:Extended synaptotagmin-3 [Acipenser ruthenus]